jgi:hypothetical protein
MPPHTAYVEWAVTQHVVETLTELWDLQSCVCDAMFYAAKVISDTERSLKRRGSEMLICVFWQY